MSEFVKSLEISSDQLRQVMAQYPTGVVAITSLSRDDRPQGMLVGSFMSLSLEPPLVTFMVALTSSTWPALKQSERIGISILAHDQQEICKKLSRSAAERFSGVDWKLSSHGSPVIDGAVASIDCEIAEVHRGGDHEIVVCRMLGLEIQRAVPALLFSHGSYGRFSQRDEAGAAASLGDLLACLDAARPHMAHLAEKFGTIVTALAPSGDDLVVAGGACAGSLPDNRIRVGHRLPSRAPLGSIFAAWGGPEAVETWIRAVNPRDTQGEIACRKLIQRIRERGHVLSVASSSSTHVAVLREQYSECPKLPLDILRSRINVVLEDYNRDLPADELIDFQFVSVPVLGDAQEPLVSLSLWGGERPFSGKEIRERVDAITAAAQSIQRARQDRGSVQ
ncbi:flavin reductase [Polaromonas sp. C04]|uniref:flavin reductase n=1 Tax=Polaromonas sp. C04 TaxID=1945857 RepID=UPI0009863CB2|nr:flavin reductase [Polaromonas sp. C04]OOG58002.1 hypothetical protein B0E49_03960 [Polaromonas sp. C04]